MGHAIAAFTSGDAAIDSFLHDQALAEQEVGLSSTTLAIEVRSGAVVGFFSISPLSIKLDARLLAALAIDPKSVRYPMVGGYLLGRLGTHVPCQGQGIGRSLVAVAMERARHGRVGGTGGVFLALDAKTDDLVRWYGGLGFKQIGQSKRLVQKL